MLTALRLNVVLQDFAHGFLALKKARAELKQLQKEGGQAETRALEAAEKIRNLKEALNQPWQPEENGFEFSSFNSPPGSSAAGSPKTPKTSNIPANSPLRSTSAPPVRGGVKPA